MALEHPWNLYIILMRNPIFIVSSKTYIHKAGDSILLDGYGHRLTIPSDSISHINKYGDSEVSTQVLTFLAKKNIILNYFTYSGRYIGTFLPSSSTIGNNHLLQCRANLDIDSHLYIAKEMLKTASLNRLALLRRYSYRNKDKIEIKETTLRLKSLVDMIDSKKNNTELLKLKDNFSTLYSDGIRLILKQIVSSETEHEPPMAEFSEIQTLYKGLLFTEFMSKVHEQCLTPHIGMLHPDTDQFPLVEDFSEMFMALLVDQPCITMINSGQLKRSHFNNKEKTLITSTEGKSFLIDRWRSLMKETVFNEDSDKKMINSDIIRREVIKFKSYLDNRTEYTGYRPK